MLHYKNIQLAKLKDFKSITINLPASKSISNRALIIAALSNSKMPIDNLSEARDTQTMLRLLDSNDSLLDVLDAGTTMRFLTSYLAITNQKKILTGTERMQERPIKILVDALLSLGAKIEYQKKEGFPPVKIDGFQTKNHDHLKIRGDVSSQYISSLLMIAPLLQRGLTLELTGKIGSRPYIEMTLDVMKSYGVQSSFIENKVIIDHQKYRPTSYRVEPDWSAASYWYSLIALSDTSEVFINDLAATSIQGDSKIEKIMQSLGVKTVFEEAGAKLSKCSHESTFKYDFTDCPDLAQTVAVICAAKGIKGEFLGLESLKIKETDRVMALQNELIKIGATLTEDGDHWFLLPDLSTASKSLEIKTYEDHRMAMAFAPLCLRSELTIENPSVVSKSYPSFWDDLSLIGVSMYEVL